MKGPTAEQVSKLSATTGEGRMVCNKILHAYFRRRALEKASNFEELKSALLAMHPMPQSGHPTLSIAYIIGDE